MRIAGLAMGLIAMPLVAMPGALHAQIVEVSSPHLAGGASHFTEMDARRDHVGKISPADEKFIGRLGARVDLSKMMRDQKGYARHYRDALKVAACIGEAETPDPGLSFEQRLLAHRDCLDKGERMDGLSLRAALGERDLGPLDGLPDRALSVDVDAARRFSGVEPGAKIDMAMIARCAAIYSPGLAGKVLAPDPGSREGEGAALDALYAGTPECGLRQRPEALSTTFQRATVALALAEARAQKLLPAD